NDVGPEQDRADHALTVLVELVHLGRKLVAFALKRRHAAARGAGERGLGGREEGVEGDERGDDERGDQKRCGHDLNSCCSSSRTTSAGASRSMKARPGARARMKTS